MNAYERAVGEAALKNMGAIPNMIKCVEELAELQRALCRYMTGPVDADTLANVHEEIADVQIMLGRMLMIFDPLEVEDWKDSKLERVALALGVEVKTPNDGRHDQTGGGD